MTIAKLKEGAARLAEDLGDPSVADVIAHEIAKWEETELNWRSFGEPEDAERWDGLS